MIKTFESIKKNFRLRPAAVTIDNLAFRLHYRATTLLLLAGCVIVSSRQYVGEHIACVTEAKAVPERVMNTFCFFTATFTVAEAGNTSSQAYPGVGPGVGQVTRHNFYQWVPFVLFGQALAFYVPHYVWKRQEGGRLQRLTHGLRHAAYSLTESSAVLAPDGAVVPSLEDTSRRVKWLRDAFITRLHVHRTWGMWLLLCEMLNTLNVPLQVWFTDIFLGGRFLQLGPYASPDELDDVFPKITKCTFHKYGPSGTLQAHDALCVLALNIVNEKIFVVLWWWYVVLGVVGVVALAWRVTAAILHSRSARFNRWVFAWGETLTVTHNYHFSDWLFLCYLTENVDVRVSKRLFRSMAEDMQQADMPLIDLRDCPDKSD